MAIRTCEAAVRDIVETDPDIKIDSFIRSASVFISQVAANDSESKLDEETLTEIETWLAAHLYSHRDQLYKSKSTDGASATFQGMTGMGLDSTQYGQTAKLMDSTGYLASLDKPARQKAGVSWLGSDLTVLRRT